MEFKVGKTTSSLILKNMGILDLIGGTYLNPTSFLAMRGFETMLAKEIFHKTHGPLFRDDVLLVKWQYMHFTPHFRRISKQFQDDFKDLDRFKYHLMLNRGITLESQIQAVRNTSVLLGLVVTDLQSDLPLATALGLAVRFNVRTGQKIAFPEDVKDVINSQENKIPGMPEPTWDYPVVQHPEVPRGVEIFSDVSYVGVQDLGFHYVAHSHYLNYCLSCLARHLPGGYFPALRGNFFDNYMRSCHLMHNKSAKLGDKIETIMWKDTESEFNFNFHLMKDDEVVCQAQFGLGPAE